ncbi:hypothetical protein niasHT_025620 [Heterodera trifolii]|uniref:Uncharacterized protein n=1 Tax=Heterodera trifolii TaxID=157864 RepID=A0ABD2KHN2_9BILA
MSDYNKLKLTPSKLGNLQIRRTQRTKNARVYKKMANQKENWYPLPEDQLPAEITSFRFIEIIYVNLDVIAFLKRIQRLLQDGEMTLRVRIFHDQRRSLQIFRTQIWPLINKNMQDNAQQQTTLNDLPNLKLLEYCDVSPSQEVIDWLHNSSTDGRPKTVRCGLPSEMVDQLRTRFVDASLPTIFIVLVHCLDDPIEPFQIDNDVTNERMELKPLPDALPNTTEFHHRRLLVRCPVDRNVEQWAQFEQTVRNWELTSHRCLYIEFDDSNLGEDITNEEGEGTSNQ